MISIIDIESSGNDTDNGGWSIFSQQGSYVDNASFWTALIISSFGLINNSFVVIVLLLTNSTPHLCILKSISFADLLNNAILLVLILYPTNYGAPTGQLGDILCRVVFSQYLLFALGAVSCWGIVLLTLDLYGSHIGEHSKWYTYWFLCRGRLRTLIILTWILGFLTMSHNVWSYKSSDDTCVLDWGTTFLRFFSGIQEFMTIIVLPLLIMCVCHGLLLRILKTAKEEQRIKANVVPGLHSVENQLETLEKYHLSSSIRTAVVMFVYIVTWVPNQAVWCAYLFNLSDDSADIFDEWYAHVTQFLPFFNATWNPIIYGWSWYEFRNAALDQLSRWFGFGTDNSSTLRSNRQSTRVRPEAVVSDNDGLLSGFDDESGSLSSSESV